MPNARAEVWKDDDHLATGTHKGGTSTTITDRGKDFKSCGVYAGLAIKNTTDSTTGSVTSATEDEIVTNITFHNGDTYKVYCTSTYDSKIATFYIDRRAGHKVTHPDQLIDGVLAEDVDVDEHDKHVFGPWQPSR